MEQIKGGLKSPLVVIYVILAVILSLVFSIPNNFVGIIRLYEFVFAVFSLLGVLALGFYALSRHRGWLQLAMVEWLIAGAPALYLGLQQLEQQPEFIISILALIGGGFIAYRLMRSGSRASHVPSTLGEWQPLGSLESGQQRIDALTPSQRDHAPINKR